MRPRASAAWAPFVLRAGLLAFALSVAASLLVEGVARAWWGDAADLPLRQMGEGPVLWALALLAAPAFETLAVMAVALPLQRLIGSPRWTVFIVALLAAAAHGPYPHTFAATSLAFAVYTHAVLRWWPAGWRWAWAAGAAPHALSNGLLLLTDAAADRWWPT